MKKLILLFIIIVAFLSCKNSTTNEQEIAKENQTTVTEKPTSLLALSCYVFSDEKNSVSFEITSLENGIKGKLTYTLDGKDSNSGTFNGTLSDDKLIGTYTFMSEGIESTREVAFLIKDNQLIEGYGALNESGTTFVDKNTINYSSKMPLTKRDCSK